MNKEEESVTPTPSMTQEEKNDLTEVFPSFRIKSILKQEEQIGRVYGSAVDQIGASSALFLKKFSESIIATARRNDDPKNNSHGGDASTSTVRIITAEHIKQCIKERGNEYDFLKDVVFDGSDDDDQDQDEEKKKKKTATKRKKKSSVPNYSLLQHQKGGSTVDTSAAIQSEENDLVISGNNKNGEGKRASIISKTAKKQNKKIKLTNDDIGLNNYLKSTDLETRNNGRRFHDDDIIEDDEEYD